MIDRDELTTEDLAEEVAALKQTPESAIQSQIFFLCQRRYEIEQAHVPDSQKLLAYIQEQIDALGLAMRQLEELRAIKRALVVLRGIGAE